ncbi:MAG: single-stranded DNA-binding protein [Bacteroides sp.]|nr:single-stranded DNA-binding protein [Eubacterium sp.]MCM1417696.1 single-stranded DNA-binding protein [Roseburia sp.]MCM1461838.1 single-stranded DNA-binding protein [Bacteroides sp.]
MYNKVILLGRITQDLELKTTQSGVSVLSFSVAVDRRYQTKGEERKADFINCVAWRNEAEFISRYWSKGRPILVEGELQTRSYIDKNNITRYVTEVIVDRASFTGDTRPQNQNTGNAGNAGYGAPPPAHPAGQTNAAPSASNGNYTANDFVETTSTDDDYPF